MEYITGGHVSAAVHSICVLAAGATWLHPRPRPLSPPPTQVLAGFHEVIVTTQTVAAIEKARAEGRSLWRISSTSFAHFASDVVLAPVGHFAAVEGAAAKYPPIHVGEQVAAELSAIKLADDSAGAGTGTGAGATVVAM
jgi:hypothetical protein